MNVLLDTNVILDFFLQNVPHYESAKKIFALASQEKIVAHVTANSVTDIYYVLAKRLGAQAARNALAQLFNLITVIAVDGDDCVTALHLPIRDYEDAVLAACAVKHGIGMVVTNDVEFVASGNSVVHVITPAMFLVE